MKPNLVIICASPNAIFQHWENIDSYNFDTAVIIYHDQPIHKLDQVKYVEYSQGFKWRNIYNFIQKHDVSKYEYIWCLDDDCLVDPLTVEKIFEFCKEHDLDLAQPSLEHGSIFTYPWSLQIPNAVMHITNMVEIMVPIFKQRIWKDCISQLGNLPIGMGLGLEYFWMGALDCNSGITKYGGKVAVIDQYSVRHIKPMNNVYNIDPWEDHRYLQTVTPGNPANVIEIIEVIYAK